MRRELLVSFLLVVAVAAAYWPVHSYTFVSLDDHGYVLKNPHVRKGLTADGLTYAFTGITVGNWHPMTMLSHMLDCQLFGVEKGAGWHHMVNLALHVANTVLLFIALRRMTGALWRSALVAALFGLHPLHVESVAWISERKDVLSTLFFMLTLLAYHHYVQRPSVLRYSAVFVLLALGLMSKPMLVTVPFVLLLLDYWPLNRMGRERSIGHDLPEQPEECFAQIAPVILPLNRMGQKRFVPLIVEKIPLFVLAAASAAMTWAVQRFGGAMGMLGEQLPVWRRLANAVSSYGLYLEKSFWPVSLAAYYPYVNRRAIDVITIGLALGAISVAAIRLAKIRPFLLVGWCWYLGTLVPVIGVVQVGVQSMADRYTYIPLIGIFIIAAWGAAEFSEDWPVLNRAIAAAVLLAVCGWLTWRQVGTWSSSEALYRNAVETQPRNLFALRGLAVVDWEEGKLADAQEQFEAMLEIQPDLEPALRDLGLLLAVRGQPQKALQQLDKASKARPQQPEPLRHKAWILATSPDDSVRDGRKAVEAAEQALERSPRKLPEYWDTLAAAQAEAGKFKEAVESAEKARQQAELTGADDLLPGIERRLKLFKSGTSYRADAQRPERD